MLSMRSIYIYPYKLRAALLQELHGFLRLHHATARSAHGRGVHGGRQGVLVIQELRLPKEKAI